MLAAERANDPLEKSLAPQTVAGTLFTILPVVGQYAR
jgi:hypothetical protein